MSWPLHVHAFVLPLTCLTALSLAVAGTPVSPPEADRAILEGDLLAPKAFRAAVQKILPSLVYIESFGGIPADQGEIGGIRRPGDGPTTGLIVSRDGYIVTSTFNFIRKPPIITVHFRDGTQRVAKLLGRDDARKVCLLKVDDVDDLPIPQLAPRPQWKVGQWAIAVGVGFGARDPAISAGIISATSRILGRAVQTDANTSPANYGGPLLDLDGRVIGICVPLSPHSEEAGSGVEWYDSGIGFAIPLDGADRLMAALKAGKTVRPAYLGVQIKPETNDDHGAVIAKVGEATPAEKVGLKIGDSIISVDAESIRDGSHLRIVIGGRIEGDAVKLRVKRGEDEIGFEVTLSAAPTETASPTPAPRRPGDSPPTPKGRKSS